MSAQENIEKILRSLHVLLSKSQPYPQEPSKVIIDKQQTLDLLVELNKSVYDIMDEYELTKQGRDRAEREFQKRGDEIIWNASRNAEDIYAASVMYTDEALSRVQEIIKEADHALASIHEEYAKKLKEEEKLLKKNQLELKSTLQDLRDTEKYLNLIEDRNKEIKKEKESEKPIEEQEHNIYANRQTEIKINQDYFDKMGLSYSDDTSESKDDASEVDLRMDLDADYFNWIEEKESEKKQKTTKEKADRFSSLLKGFTSDKK